MTVAPTDTKEADGAYPAPLHGWTCFHCGEEFSIAKQGSHHAAVEAATEHFGPDPRWTPACIELARTRPQQLYRRLRAAEIKLAEWAPLTEEVEYARSQHHRLSLEVAELRNKLDFTEGLLEVERLRLREAR